MFKAASEPDLTALASLDNEDSQPFDTSPLPRATFMPAWVGAQLGDDGHPDLAAWPDHVSDAGLAVSHTGADMPVPADVSRSSAEISGSPHPSRSYPSPPLSIPARTPRAAHSPWPASAQPHVNNTSVSFSDYIQVEAGHNPHPSMPEQNEEGDLHSARRPSNYQWSASMPTTPLLSPQSDPPTFLPIPPLDTPPNGLGLADMLAADAPLQHTHSSPSHLLSGTSLAPLSPTPSSGHGRFGVFRPSSPSLAIPPRRDPVECTGSPSFSPVGVLSSDRTGGQDECRSSLDPTTRQQQAVPAPGDAPPPAPSPGLGASAPRVSFFGVYDGAGNGGYDGAKSGTGVDEYACDHLPPAKDPAEAAAQEFLVERLNVDDANGETILVEPAHAARRYKLACCEILADGTVTARMLSRTEIMQAARETMPKNAPSPKVVARWLGRPEEESVELREFSARYGGGKEASRKAMQKALRNYLRNSLQPRDIRQVDPAFSAKPALWVRHSALVVSLEGVRAIILHNRVFLFAPDNPVVQTAINVIQESIKTSPDMLEDPNMPFEFKALEGIFITGILGLQREFNMLKPNIDSHLNELPNQLTTKMLEDLRANKQCLNQFLSRANNVRGILENLLEEDEDMANMYLTEKHNSPNHSRNVVDHDEAEMLLEAYMQFVDDLVNRADLLSDEIEDTEDLVMIHLDTLRNRLLSVELAMSVVSMTFAFGGLVGGVFGMNLHISLYESTASKFWFLGVVLFILSFVVIVSWTSLSALNRRGLCSFR
jgi:magnesium transporter